MIKNSKNFRKSKAFSNSQKPKVFEDCCHPENQRFSTVLIKRKNDPYKGSWALPGGFVEWGETVESAVLREAKEETGLEIDLIALVGVYSDPKRDPRGHTVTICYLAREKSGKLQADTDASHAKCFKKDDILKLKLAFDHDIILKDAFKLLNNSRR